MDKKLKEFIEKKLDIKTEKQSNQDIAKKCWEKIEDIYKKIEELLYPDSGIAEMFEAEQLSKDIKHELSNMYALLNKIKNLYFIAKATNSRKDYDAFFTQLCNNWDKIIKVYVEALRQAIDAWNNTPKERRESYFG